MENLERILEVCLASARAGGEVLDRNFESKSATQKSQSFNLVTKADLDSEKAVVAEITKTFPDHQILGEESSAERVTEVSSAQHLWVIDPLDGTNNFVHKIPHFAVSIAYYHRGVATVGVVLNPITEEIFSAVLGQGALRNGVPIEVADDDHLNQSIVGVGFYYDRAGTMRKTLTAIDAFFQYEIHGIRRMGTASLDLCNVACGRFGAYFEYELAPWDFAAGRLVVQEAGGIVTDCLGEPLQLRNSSVLATNGKLHQAACEITKANHP